MPRHSADSDTDESDEERDVPASKRAKPTPPAPAASAVPAMLFFVAVVTSALHGLFSVLAKGCITNYVYFAVEPGWAFVFADLLQGAAFGAALIGYMRAPDDTTEPLVATVVLVACHGLMVYKSGVIAWDVYKGRRDSLTGAPLGSSGRPLRRSGF